MLSPPTVRSGIGSPIDMVCVMPWRGGGGAEGGGGDAVAGGDAAEVGVGGAVGGVGDGDDRPRQGGVHAGPEPGVVLPLVEVGRQRSAEPRSTVELADSRGS